LLSFMANNYGSLAANQSSVRNYKKAIEFSFRTMDKEKTMPVIFLWAGLPVLLVGGGYVIYRIIA
jgi:hypothetical protein